jgi:tRNA dimethylallyltransferase
MGAPIFIAGPTAAGKSSVAIEVAKAKDGEIISVDSMQVYCGLDLGTAKPTTEERALLPHHLIDAVELNESFDAASFVTMARGAREKIELPIFCGGTGLYFKAWIEGLGESPGANEEVRTKLEEQETSELLMELKEKDPTTYQAIDRQNRRRIVRAIEVIRLSGKPFSIQRAEWTGKTPSNFFALQRGPEDLRRRIDARADQMFADGLVEETRALLPVLEQNRTAQQALGYRQVIGHLRGEQDLPATVALVKSRTWQFARRQQTWMRKMRGAMRIEVGAEESPDVTARRIIDLLK